MLWNHFDIEETVQWSHIFQQYQFENIKKLTLKARFTKQGKFVVEFNSKTGGGNFRWFTWWYGMYKMTNVVSAPQITVMANKKS